MYLLFRSVAAAFLLLPYMAFRVFICGLCFAVFSVLPLSYRGVYALLAGGLGLFPGFLYLFALCGLGILSSFHQHEHNVYVARRYTGYPACLGKGLGVDGYKMWFKDSNNLLTPVMTDIPECYNMPRQQLPKIYYQNACIDVIRTDVILKQNSMSGKIIAGYEMDENFDIDTEEEFLAAEKYITEHGI